jgi:hypothetical protein
MKTMILSKKKQWDSCFKGYDRQLHKQRPQGHYIYQLISGTWENNKNIERVNWGKQ